MQKKLLVAALGTLIAMPALAEEAAPYTLTANVGITSDYVFRGISQTFRAPAVQGGFDFVHSNGLFLGTWASNVSATQFTNANMEWDLYGGYNGSINDDLGYTVGLITVYYPGSKTQPGVAGSKNFDTTEWNIGATWKGLNVKYSQTLTDWYGIAGGATGGLEPTMTVGGATTANNATGTMDSKGSGYFEANYSYEVAEGLTLSAHAGHQKIKNYDKLTYTDYKLGVSKALGKFTLGASYTSTNVTDNNLYHLADANGTTKWLGNGILAVSLSSSF